MPMGPNGTRCRVCSCTYERACSPGCSWVPGQEDLCDSCDHTAKILAQWMEIAHRPSMAALVREAAGVLHEKAPRLFPKQHHKARKNKNDLVVKFFVRANERRQ